MSFNQMCHYQYFLDPVLAKMTLLYTTFTPCSHESELLPDFRALNMVSRQVLIAEMRINMLAHSVNVTYLARAGHFV